MSENIDIRARELPALGSTESAVVTCVNLLSKVCGKPEDVMAYWLDLYYQVRAAYERTQRAEEATITRKDIEDFMRQTLEKTLKTDEPEEATAPAVRNHLKGNTFGTDAAHFKSATFDRLNKMRKKGVTIAQIVEAGDGSFTDETVLQILEAKKISVDRYRSVATALDRIEI